MIGAFARACEGGDAIEISVTGEATVSDLRDVLVKWESLKQAVVDYAKHEKSGLS